VKKNVAGQQIGAQLVSATDGSAFTGAVTVAVTGDAGTQAMGSVGGGACTHEGGGYHTYAPAQAETNYDLIAFTFTASGAIPVTVQVYTTWPQSGDAYAETAHGTYGLAALEALVDELESRLTAGRATNLDNLDAAVSTRLATAGYTAPDNAGITTLLARLTAARAGYLDELDATTAGKAAAEIDVLKSELQHATYGLAALEALVDDLESRLTAARATALDKLDSAMEQDGAVYRFTANALEQAPTGAGGAGDWTTDEKSQIRHRLGIDGTAAAPAATPSLAMAADLGTVAGYLDTEIAAIKAKTDLIPAGGPAAASEYSAVRAAKLDNLDAAVSTRSTYAGSDTAGTTTLLGRIPGTVQPQTGDAFARLGAPSGASVSADVAAAKADTAAIKAKTDLIPAGGPAAAADYTAARAAKLDQLDAAVSSRASQAALDTLDDLVDTEVAAIKAKTDQLVFTEANKVDATAEATVDEQAIAASIVAALGGSAEITLVSPVLASGDVSLVRGDDYAHADNRALTWSSTSWPDLTGATVTFSAKPRRGGTTFTKAATVVNATTVRLELTAADTNSLVADAKYDFDLQAELAVSERVVTLFFGVMTCKEDVTTVPV
jgi:hypothetical protein